VPISGAADTAPGLEDTHGKAYPAEAMQHVHSGETGADDHGIERASLLRVGVLIRHAFSYVLVPGTFRMPGHGRLYRLGWQPIPGAFRLEKPRHRQARHRGRPIASFG